VAAQTTKRDERMKELVEEALAADRDIESGGEVFASEDVHAWLAARAGRTSTPH
jgi:hypothetical protein